ncbi:MAG: 50S ribosomal protein L4 [Candidatus Aenigmarchaeota archaeon]|nr:50S ribosomal protein L4 [Candidatus Aenigmarchaeota archaeon]
MRIPVYGLKGEEKGDVTSRMFSNAVRKDLIIKAFLAEASRQRQPYGVDPLAGKRTSAKYIGRRHRRNSMMNREMARTKRIVGMGYLNFTARFVPQATKGRKAHPPKAGKVWKLKINKKERMRAMLSAIAASSQKDMVESRGHIIREVKHMPIVVNDELENLKKARDVVKTLASLGLQEEMERLSEKKVRAGIGKMRGRRYRKRKGPLIVVKDDKGIIAAAGNIPGVDIVTSRGLSVSMLAPGASPGRLCIWTKSAIEDLEGLAR